MLKNIFQSVENSKSKKFISYEDVENSVDPGKIDFVCEKCGGENFYLPIKSNCWECRDCNPPRSERFVAQSKQGRRSEDTTLDGTTEPELIRVDLAQSWGPYVLRAEIQVCECGCEYWRESGTVLKINISCVCCGKEISLP
jgi:hypothetical protein